METKIVAEISITTSGARFGWRVHAPGSITDEWTGSESGGTEAVWRALDAIRSEDSLPGGMVAVYHHDRQRVAYAPVWCVPQYQLLRWEPVLRHEAVQIELAAAD